MEPYKITIGDRHYSVSVQDDHTYLIQSDGINEFIICPKTTEDGVEWNVEKGMADQDLVFALGQAIEKHEL